MEIHPHVPKMGKTLPHWLLEGLFIIISVALGFAIAQIRESRANHELSERVLKGLALEIEHNLGMMEQQRALHVKWLRNLNGSLNSQSQSSKDSFKTARDVFMSTWPDLNPKEITQPFPIPLRGAWDAALSTGALRLVDYDLVAGLSEIYQLQQALESGVDKLPISSNSFFDPTSQTSTVRQLAFTMNGIELTEGLLIEAYHRHLPAIRAAAAGER